MNLYFKKDLDPDLDLSVRLITIQDHDYILFCIYRNNDSTGIRKGILKKPASEGCTCMLVVCQSVEFYPGLTLLKIKSHHSSLHSVDVEEYTQLQLIKWYFKTKGSLIYIYSGHVRYQIFCISWRSSVFFKKVSQTSDTCTIQTKFFWMIYWSPVQHTECIWRILYKIFVNMIWISLFYWIMIILSSKDGPTWVLSFSLKGKKEMWDLIHFPI